MDYFKVHNLRRWTHMAYMAYHYPLYIFYKMHLISEGAYRKPWPAHLGWYIRGYTTAEADQIWYWVIENYMNQYWREETCQLLKQHRQNNQITFLVSGTPVPLLKRIAEHIGADHAVGTVLEMRDGHFTGSSIGPACIDAEKARLTYQYIQENGLQIDFQSSFAYADSISDQHILEIVGQPIATYPDEKLRALALEKSWQIYPPD